MLRTHQRANRYFCVSFLHYILYKIVFNWQYTWTRNNFSCKNKERILDRIFLIPDILLDGNWTYNFTHTFITEPSMTYFVSDTMYVNNYIIFMLRVISVRPGHWQKLSIKPWKILLPFFRSPSIIVRDWTSNLYNKEVEWTIVLIIEILQSLFLSWNHLLSTVAEKSV